jgi:hypothetical protein
VRVWLRGFERAVRRSPLRMPVILPPDTWAEWLAEEPADEAALKKMLVPDPAEPMTMWRSIGCRKREEQRSVADRASVVVVSRRRRSSNPADAHVSCDGVKQKIRKFPLTSLYHSMALPVGLGVEGRNICQSSTSCQRSPTRTW